MKMNAGLKKLRGMVRGIMDEYRAKHKVRKVAHLKFFTTRGKKISRDQQSYRDIFSRC